MTYTTRRDFEKRTMHLAKSVMPRYINNAPVTWHQASGDMDRKEHIDIVSECGQWFMAVRMRSAKSWAFRDDVTIRMQRKNGHPSEFETWLSNGGLCNLFLFCHCDKEESHLTRWSLLWLEPLRRAYNVVIRLGMEVKAEGHHFLALRVPELVRECGDIWIDGDWNPW